MKRHKVLSPSSINLERIGHWLLCDLMPVLLLLVVMAWGMNQVQTYTNEAEKGAKPVSNQMMED